MNIYNKVTLSVILVITIIISFLFYFYTTEKKVDKDKLYENKITNHKQAGKPKNYGVASNNKIATKVGNKIIEDGGNAVDAAIGVFLCTSSDRTSFIRTRRWRCDTYI